MKNLILITFTFLSITQVFAVRFTNYKENNSYTQFSERRQVLLFSNTGFLIAPNIAMTAFHTRTTGMYTMARDPHPYYGQDTYYYSQGEILESDEEADYKIFKISWFQMNQNKPEQKESS